jgi:hypothetical protein
MLDRAAGKAECLSLLSHLRSHGCHDLLVYRQSGLCNHGAVLNANWLPDENAPVRSLSERMVCTAPGLIGADVRPDWSPHTNRRVGPLAVIAIAP